MPSVVLSGFLHDSVGVAVSGATVNTFKRNDTGTALSTATTNASGYWSITEAAADAAWLDVQITNGTEITRYKYDDAIQVTRADVQTIVQRNSSGVSSFGITFALPTLTADRTITWPNDSGTVALSGQFQNASQMVFGSGVELNKTSSQSIASTTLENDTHLQITLSSATTYKVDLLVYYTMGSSGDLNAKWSVSSGAALYGQWKGQGQEVTVTEASSADLNSGVGSPAAATFTGRLTTGASAGTLIPQWRQSGAESTATVIHAGTMRVTRISS